MDQIVGTFPSKSGGKGHTVSQRSAKDGTSYLVCTCPGGAFAWTRGGEGCWAMKAVRQQSGTAIVSATPAKRLTPSTCRKIAAGNAPKPKAGAECDHAVNSNCPHYS